MKKYFISVLGVMFAFVMIVPIAQGASQEDVQAQINALLSQLNSLRSQLSQMGGGTTRWCHDFNANLGVGNGSGDEVKSLQTVLGKEGFGIDAAETSAGLYDESTAAAVSGFQLKYRSEVLAPSGLKYTTGYAGKSTRAKLNQLYGCGNAVSTPTVTSAPTQTVAQVPATQQVTTNSGWSPVTGYASAPSVSASTAQAPTITSIKPESAAVGGTIYVYGTNFDKNTVVVIDGSYGVTITPISISATSLGFVVPSNVSIGYHPVQVNEKGGNFPLSNSVALTVISTQQTSALSPVTIDLKVNGSYNPAAVVPNSQVDVTWTSTNAGACSTYGANPSLVGGGTYSDSARSHLSPSGSLKLMTGPDGGVLVLGIQCLSSGSNPPVSKSITLSVVAPNAPIVPVTVDLKVNGSYNPLAVAQNSQVDVTWTSTNSVSCSTYGNDLPLVGGGTYRDSAHTHLSPSGSFKVMSGSAAGVLTFGMQCFGPYPNPSVSKSITMTVSAPDAPMIPATVDFKVNGSYNPAAVAPNSLVTVTWTSANSISCSTYGADPSLVGGGTYADSAHSHLPTSGSLQFMSGSTDGIITLGMQCFGSPPNPSVSKSVLLSTAAAQANPGASITPTVTDVTTSSVLAPGFDAYSIKVAADVNHAIGIYKMTFKIAAMGVNASNFQLVGPSGAVNASGVNPVAKFSGVPDAVEIVFDSNAADRLVPAGTSKVYRLRANTITGLTSQNAEALNIQFVGDSVAPAASASAAAIDAGANNADNFIWTPFSATIPSASFSAVSNPPDFTNGYGVPGFPGLGQSMPMRVFSD